MGFGKVVSVQKFNPSVIQVSFTDLVRNQKGDLLFVQLPDVLPGQVDEIFLTSPISYIFLMQAVKAEGGAYGCNLASLGEVITNIQ